MKWSHGLLEKELYASVTVSPRLTVHAVARTNSDPDFIITGYVSRVYGYDPEPVIFLRMKIRREH